MDPIRRTWGRLTIEADVGLSLVTFRCLGKPFDVTPTLHVAGDPLNRMDGLRMSQALGDADGYPPDGVRIAFFGDDALPSDVQERKAEYFAQWWRLLFNLFLVHTYLPLFKPRVLVRLQADVIQATRGEAGRMIREACLRAGAKSVEVTERAHAGHFARTG